MDIAQLCLEMDAFRASDLFIAAGKPAGMRVMGDVEELRGEPASDEDIYSFIDRHFPAGTRERFIRERDVDMGVSLTDNDRFRVNMFFQRGRPGLAIRRVPLGELVFADLLIPDVVRELAEKPRGLVLVTGATGSGKSTTMAAMLHHINTHFHKHVVTIEDPIEFFHPDKLCVVSQREVGGDTRDFHTALKHVVRQNPDAIFFGEMRDLETIETAISAAMTGHLVVTTMHTMDVTQTLERVVNYFPQGMRDQIAQDFAMSLAGIVSQRLLPRKDGNGRVPVFEIVTATPLVRRLIAQRRLDDIIEAVKAGKNEGMVTFTRSLVDRCEASLLDIETAARGATNREEFLLAAQGMETGVESLREYHDEAGQEGLSMKTLLRDAVRHGASDLLLTVKTPPTVRLDGKLMNFDMPPLTSADTQKLLFSLLSPSQRAQFESEKEIDFALSVADRFGLEVPGHSDARFRVNGFYQKGCVAAAFRMIPQTIPSAEDLRIPAVVMGLARRFQGLVLVTGPTGHGKSTTLACMIREINRTRPCHIITVEDPIEFVHENDQAVVEQREVTADTKTFGTALKYVLRQNPDVILIGEMRDPETIAAALTAAETGHLVLATLHTNDAPQTVDRIIDVFPSERQNQVRTQLAACLEAIIAQRLLPRAGKDGGRIAAFEIMLGSTPVRACIREQRTHQLLGIIETAAREGMVTMDRALRDIFQDGLISRETYLNNARNPILPGGGF